MELPSCECYQMEKKIGFLMENSYGSASEEGLSGCRCRIRKEVQHSENQRWSDRLEDG